MSLQEILQSGANVSITIQASDLKEFLHSVVGYAKKELEEAVISDKAETYPSPKQVSEILNVDLSTLWRWQKKGYLVPAEVGGKRRYKMSEVKALLNKKGVSE